MTLKELRAKQSKFVGKFLPKPDKAWPRKWRRVKGVRVAKHLTDKQFAQITALRKKLKLSGLSRAEADEMLMYWTFEQIMEFLGAMGKVQ